jgi:hypothetical protein
VSCAFFRAPAINAEGTLTCQNKKNFLITVEAKSKLDEVTHPKATLLKN